jgi:UDPglucose 6-dehydrogenase
MFEEFKYTLNVTPATVPDLEKSITTCSSALEAATGAHAIALMTEWDEFTILDFNALYAVMAKPAFVFDGRNILPHAAMRKIGFEVYAIGKPEQIR